MGIRFILAVTVLSVVVASVALVDANNTSPSPTTPKDASTDVDSEVPATITDSSSSSVFSASTISSAILHVAKRFTGLLNYTSTE